MSPVIPILTAPTAAGKTALALAIAARVPLEIVSADAFTVYRGLDIGTAKPAPDERNAVPHHLIDIAEVTEFYDVARFVRDAEAALHDILARGKQPLVVGGTGFYLRALMRGLPLTPPSDPGTRGAIEAELHSRGLDALLAEIAGAHPAEAARMERNPRRIVRALEVYRSTGRFPGEFGTSPPAFRYQVTAFTRPSAELEARMHQRIQVMLDQGWPQEARWLASRVEPATLPRPTAWQALGYTEALAVAEGSMTLSEAAAAVLGASRQYARRQLTFMRTQLGAIIQTVDGAQAELSHHLVIR
ncbi:tRNA dimethylallyltransferase [Deinococcus malanensis]|uniref:tRNA dimethylallyltransferase n=1 Tax=Deinococcus malanensis TaxID=1706855 RepID=A0ABQ2ETI7_9DEIO|nr:tRNA (adenosine(37)-N6)-dimethylallyltransferase MiaA [Deinococcus malanensis]GGK19953.1 tRNA dimethylallyltransferase [Deinococcus malanensis]